MATPNIPAVGKFLSDNWDQVEIADSPDREEALAQMQELPGAEALSPDDWLALQDPAETPGEKLVEWRDQYRLARFLVTLATDLSFRLRYREARRDVLAAFGLSPAHQELFEDFESRDHNVAVAADEIRPPDPTLRQISNESFQKMVAALDELDASGFFEQQGFKTWMQLNAIHVHTY